MNRKILFIDDEPDLGALVSKRLRAAGYETDYLGQSSTSLQRAQRFHPDLILLDLKMPELSGDEVFKQLQQDPELKKIPVIFFTALREEEAMLKEKNPGVPVLKKPYKSDLMLRTIEQVLQSPRPATKQ